MSKRGSGAGLTRGGGGWKEEGGRRIFQIKIIPLPSPPTPPQRASYLPKLKVFDPRRFLGSPIEAAAALKI